MELVKVEKNSLKLMPTQKVVEYFLNNQESEGTSRTYGNSIRYFFAWTGGKSFKDITPLDALNYNEYLKQHNSPATIQNKISALRQFFEFCKTWGLIEKNPFAIVKQKGIQNRTNEKYLTVKELDKLLDALYSYKKPQRYIAGLLLVSLGLRVSETVQINHNDFLELPDGNIGVRIHRKGGDHQIIPLRNDVWKVVRDFMGHDIDPSDDRPLFLNPSGNRISTESMRAWIREAAKKARIKKNVSTHWLRHSTATHLLDRGESLENVRWLLNHKSIRTTAIYTHPTRKRISEKMPIKVKRGRS